MLIKFFTACILSLSLFFISAANEKEKKAPIKKQPTIREQMRILMQKDPRVPDLPLSAVNNRIQLIETIFIAHQLPVNAGGLTVKNKIGLSTLKTVANSYKNIISHPDLQETTGNNQEWYNKIGMALIELAPDLATFDEAYLKSDDKAYQPARKRYLEKIKVLEKILETPEKLPAKDLEKLKEVNTLRRKTEIQKKIRALEQKRRQNQ